MNDLIISRHNIFYFILDKLYKDTLYKYNNLVKYLTPVIFQRIFHTTIAFFEKVLGLVQVHCKQIKMRLLLKAVEIAI